MAAHASNNLATAAAQGDLTTVKQLVRQGHDVNQRSKDGMTALGISAFWGYADIANCLLENGAGINTQNVGTLWTPVHCAAFQGHGPVILKLMNHNPDLSLKDSKERTAADFASANDAIWPLFAANGCHRTQKSELIKKDIIEKVNYEEGPQQSHFSERPGSAYVIRAQNSYSMAERDPQMEVAAITGDVLAAEEDHSYQMPTNRGLIIYDN